MSWSLIIAFGIGVYIIIQSIDNHFSKVDKYLEEMENRLSSDIRENTSSVQDDVAHLQKTLDKAL